MTSASDRATNLIWIDLEMTGLCTQNDTIIEIATIVTDKYLNELAEGPGVELGQRDLLGSREGDLFLDVVLHVGTLGSVLMVYRRDVARLLRLDAAARGYLLALAVGLLLGLAFWLHIFAVIHLAAVALAFAFLGGRQAPRSLGALAAGWGLGAAPALAPRASFGPCPLPLPLLRSFLPTTVERPSAKADQRRCHAFWTDFLSASGRSSEYPATSYRRRASSSRCAWLQFAHSGKGDS